jgi:branched-subunit amino acid transport protein AzlD
VSSAERVLVRWVPIADFAFVAGLLLWAVMPPSVSGPLPRVVEWYMPAVVLAALMAATFAGVVLSRGRAALPWVALAVVLPLLAAELLLSGALWTFPGGLLARSSA